MRTEKISDGRDGLIFFRFRPIWPYLRKFLDRAQLKRHNVLQTYVSPLTPLHIPHIWRARQEVTTTAVVVVAEGDAGFRVPRRRSHDGVVVERRKYCPPIG